MSDAEQRDIAEALFEPKQSREEIKDAIKLEEARRAAMVKNLYSQPSQHAVQKIVPLASKELRQLGDIRGKPPRFVTLNNPAFIIA